MLAKSDVAKVYETVLSIPGMNESVKITLNINRKNLLLLNKIIERGLSVKNPDDKAYNVLDILPEESLQELQLIAVELLQKAGLTEMNEKLQAL